MPTLSDIIRLYGAIPPLASFRKPLFVGPHPDDIEFCCGGLVAKMAEAGASVTFAVATDGAAGTDDPAVTPEMMKETREKESRSAAAFLGVQRIEFLGLEDGGPYTVEDAVKALIPLILEIQPDIIFVTDPKLRTECHPDHLKIGQAVREAVKLVPYPVALRRHGISVEGVTRFPADITLAFYATDDANKTEAIEARHLDAKFGALALHASQMQDGSTELLLSYFRLKAMELGRDCDTGLAENYQVLVPLVQHVYAEGLHY